MVRNMLAGVLNLKRSNRTSRQRARRRFWCFRELRVSCKSEQVGLVVTATLVTSEVDPDLHYGRPPGSGSMRQY